MPSSACRVERARQPTSKRSLMSPATRAVLQKTSDLIPGQAHIHSLTSTVVDVDLRLSGELNHHEGDEYQAKQ